MHIFAGKNIKCVEAIFSTIIVLIWLTYRAIQPRPHNMLGKHFTTELHSSPRVILFVVNGNCNLQVYRRRYIRRVNQGKQIWVYNSILNINIGRRKNNLPQGGTFQFKAYKITEVSLREDVLFY